MATPMRGEVTEALVGSVEPGGLVLLAMAALEEGGTSEAEGSNVCARGVAVACAQAAGVGWAAEETRCMDVGDRADGSCAGLGGAGCGL